MLADRVPLEQITVEARRADVARTLLTLVAAVLYGIGWSARAVLGAIWLAAAWSATAVRLGWVEAGQRGRP